LDCKGLQYSKGAVLYVDFGTKMTKDFKTLFLYVGNLIFYFYILFVTLLQTSFSH